jgi:nucleoside-diphosphate-sugar epimerase
LTATENITEIVTGATGLVGSHLLYELASRGRKVKAVAHNSKNIAKVETLFSFYHDKPQELLQNIEWYEMDILDYYGLTEIIESSSRVYHCAGEVSFDRKRKKQILEVNIKGTANVVNACIEKAAVKLCHVSSVAAIGDGEKGEAICEKNIWQKNPKHTVYSISKFYSEMEVWRGIEEGLNAVIVNPTIIIGPTLSDSEGIGALFESVKKGLKFYPPGRSGFVDVRDVARIMIMLMENDRKSERFIVNAENLDYRQLLNEISRANGNAVNPSIVLTRTMSKFAIAADTVISLIRGKASSLTNEIINSSFSRDNYSTEKIVSTLNYKYIPIVEAINNAVQFRSSGIVSGKV